MCRVPTFFTYKQAPPVVLWPSVFWHKFGMQTRQCTGFAGLADCRLCNLCVANLALCVTSTELVVAVRLAAAKVASILAKLLVHSDKSSQAIVPQRKRVVLSKVKDECR